MLFWRVNVKIVRSERNAVEIRNFFRKKATLQPCMNRGMLKTVVRNLISNAIKFSNENSEVLVKLEAKDGMAVVSVQDHGCGIDEEGQKKLLHTDTHFSTFGTNNEEGSGLGLLLCQDFVVKNGGKLWFTSKMNLFVVAGIIITPFWKKANHIFPILSFRMECTLAFFRLNVVTLKLASLIFCF